MPYLCELGTGQRLYLDNSGNQTIVTVSSSSPGQQQQSSAGFPTGQWTAAPVAYQTSTGIVLKLKTAQGDYYIQTQGSSIRGLSQIPPLDHAQPVQVQPTAEAPTSMQPMQPLPPMQPMQPLPPMQMGDMQMNLQPMEMQMGDMTMRLGPPPAAPTASQANSHRFCSQCGAAVASSDRFCSQCGHRLGP